MLELTNDYKIADGDKTVFDLLLAETELYNPCGSLSKALLSFYIGHTAVVDEGQQKAAFRSKGKAFCVNAVDTPTIVSSNYYGQFIATPNVTEWGTSNGTPEASILGSTITPLLARILSGEVRWTGENFLMESGVYCWLDPFSSDDRTCHIELCDLSVETGQVLIYSLIIGLGPNDGLCLKLRIFGDEFFLHGTEAEDVIKQLLGVSDYAYGKLSRLTDKTWVLTRGDNMVPFIFDGSSIKVESVYDIQAVSLMAAQRNTCLSIFGTKWLVMSQDKAFGKECYYLKEVIYDRKNT